MASQASVTLSGGGGGGRIASNFILNRSVKISERAPTESKPRLWMQFFFLIVLVFTRASRFNGKVFSSASWVSTLHCMFTMVWCEVCGDTGCVAWRLSWWTTWVELTPPSWECTGVSTPPLHCTVSPSCTVQCTVTTTVWSHHQPINQILKLLPHSSRPKTAYWQHTGDLTRI